MNTEIKLYATNWCFACRRAKMIFERLQVPYQFIDIEKDTAARAFVEQTNNGYRSVPTIVFPDGSHLTEPRDSELEMRLRQLQAAAGEG